MNKLAATKLSYITLAAFKKLMKKGAFVVTLDKSEMCTVLKELPEVDKFSRKISFTEFKRCDKNQLKRDLSDGSLIQITTAHSNHVCYVTK